MAGSVFDLFARLMLDTSEYEKGLDNAKGYATGAGSKIGGAIKTGMKVAGAALAAGTAAVTAFGAASVKDGMSFDAAMSQVKAISGANAEQFDQLREKAIEMGAATKFSATESAEAFNYMAMAGWKPQQMMEGISGVMNLAAASGEDLALTSDIVTDAITAFGMAAGDSGHFADTLAAAAANSNTNVSMLGEAFKYTAPVVGAMFKEVEDGSSIAETTAVALGVMANSGIKASMGGTALRSVFSRLAKPTKEVRAAMDAVGISLQDDSGHAYTMMEVLEQIRNGFKNNLQIPADEAARQLNELNAQLEAGTITEKEYDAAVETLTNRAFGASGALNAQYAAALAGKPAMSGLLAIISASDEDWDKLTSSIQNSSEELAKLEDGSIVPLSQAMADGSKVMEIYQGQAEAMARTMNDNLAGDITILKSNLETLHIAISDVLTPSLRNFVQFATSGIAQVTTAFRQDGLQGAIQALGPVIEQGIQLLFSALPKVLEAATSLLTFFVSAIVQNLPTLIPAGIQLVQQIVQSISENAVKLLDGALQVIMSLADGLIQALPQLIPSIVQIILAIVQKLTEPDTLMQLLEAAHQIIIAIAEGLIKSLPDLLVAIPQIIMNLVIAFLEGRQKMIESGEQLLKAAKDGFAQAIPDLIAKAKEAAEKPIETIKQKWESAKAIGSLLIQALQSGISEKVSSLNETITKITTSISDALKRFSESAKSFGSNIIQSVRAGIAERVSDIRDQIQQLQSSISDIFRHLADSAASWGRDLIGNFVSGLQEKLQALKDKAVAIAQQIKDVIGFSEPKEGPLSNFHTFAPDMMELFAKGVRDNEGLITSAISDSFDLRSQIANGFNAGTVVSRGSSFTPGGSTRNLTVILQVGRTELARVVHELNEEETQRWGAKLSTGGIA